MVQRPAFAGDPACLYGIGFSRWKQRIVRQFFSNSRLLFVRRAEDIPQNSDVVVWGMASIASGFPPNINVHRLEDGFLRSVGLGADMVRPLSWVVDRRGIHYDARQPSDLEILLTETIFDSEILLRAASLRECIVANGITKYNLGISRWQRPSQAVRIILVPGQVETDSSLLYGAPGICRNIDLLRTVRERNPNAYLVYKPHPDVVVRMRAQGAGEADALLWCDEIVTDASMANMLDESDEVHVMTSLAGFEALLRQKSVTCYGIPFYSGWGLTTDCLPMPRRQRQLSLDELVAGCLIIYPRYLSYDGKRLLTVEETINVLIDWRNRNPNAVPWWWPAARVFLRLLRGNR